MSQFHHPDDDNSGPQSEALPTMSGGSDPIGVDMTCMNNANHHHELLSNTPNLHHHHQPEVIAAPWGDNPSTDIAYNHHIHAPPPPPPPHGSYHTHLPPPKGHEQQQHPHGGYPPYGSSPHHYPPYPPPHHESHYPPSGYHYPPKYGHHPPHHSHQMYHPPPPPPHGYYQHGPPPPHYHHHYPPHHHHHHHPHGQPPPHGSYPPHPPQPSQSGTPHHHHYYSSVVPTQDVSPNNHTNYDDTKEDESASPKESVAKTVAQSQQHQQQQQDHALPLPPPQEVNMVTPAAITPGVTSTTNDVTTMPLSPRTASTDNNLNDDGSISPATKQLFASTPHYLSNPSTNTTFASINQPHASTQFGPKYQYRKKQVHKSITSKGLLPLDHNRNETFSGFEDSLIVAPRRETEGGNTTPSWYENGAAVAAGRVEEKILEDDDDDDEEEVGHYGTSHISAVAATAANTAAQISGGGSIFERSSGRSGTNFHTVTSPSQMAEIKSLSNQARAQIAQMKRTVKQHQQVESQRVADIAHVDVPFNEGYTTTSTTDDDNHVADGSDQTTKVKKATQKRYKDKDGFIYYRRVGNKHYKKLFEKGLVPKGDDGDSDDAKVVERVNAIQTITTTAAITEDGISTTVQSQNVEVPVIHRPKTDEGGLEEKEEDDDEILSRRGMDRPVEEEEEDVGGMRQDSNEQEPSLHLPPPTVRQTQLLYSHQQKRPISDIDGYELRVVPHEDGNDFHVELVQPAAVMMEHTQQWHDAEGVESVTPASAEEKGMEEDLVATSPSSLPSADSKKSGKKNVEAAAAVGSKKNVGEFFSAVDSILDAAETIAKRDSPSNSPVAVPLSQNQQTENFDLPGISSSTKRKCTDMIQGYQEEKRQRSNSGVAFNPRAYPAPSTSTYSYPPPTTVRPSPPQEARVVGPSPQSNAVGPAPPLAYSQITCQDRKEKRGRRTYVYPHPSVDLTEYYSSRQVSKTRKEELTALALCAASHIQNEPVLFRAILLNMALERERDSPKRHSGGAPTHLKNLALKRLSSQNSDGSTIDNASVSAVDSSGKKVIRDGFFWKDVPELEKVLQKHMMEYYFMSENRPQSKKQQQFNNRLVSLVYQEAIARGFIFDPVTFSLEGDGSLDFSSITSPIECGGNWIIPPRFNHKKLRDRIRCYYKTHVQNSKKRLGTLLKNPIKERNRDILLRLVNELKSQEHVELSSECVVALKRLKTEQDSIVGNVSTPDGISAAASSSSSSSSAGGYYPGDHSQQSTTTTPYHSSRAIISDGGSGSSSSTAHSVQTPHAPVQQPASMFSPFKHASLLSSMRQLDSQRH